MLYAAILNTVPRKSRGSAVTPYTHEEARDLVNWLFHRILSPPGRNHVFDLCSDYRHGDSEVNAGITVYALTLAKQSSMPATCHDFLNAYSSAKKKEISTESKHHKILYISSAVRLYGKYEILMSICARDHPR
jgi:hypothetical protein